MNFSIRPLEYAADTWLDDLLTQSWGSKFIVTRGNKYDATSLPGLVAFLPSQSETDKPGASRIIGVILYVIDGVECEIRLVQSLVENQGVATALIQAVKNLAAAQNCRRLWLITTNDNLKAIGFYQRRGFVLAAVHKNALAVSRQLKPEIPEIGLDSIPLRDEIELEMTLPSAAAFSPPSELPSFPRRLARRTIYSSNWVALHLDRVLLTTGRIIEDFHIVEAPRAAVAALVENEEGRLLFEQVYRYPTGRLEWEIPAGGIDPDEDILEAAGREVFEETGYQTANHQLIYHYYPANGNYTARFYVVRCLAGARTGAEDPAEILCSAWLSWDEIDRLLADNEIQDGLTLCALLLEKSRMKGSAQ